jgi:hypothetical protein
MSLISHENLNMKKVKAKPTRLKSESRTEKRLEKARLEYEKTIAEMAPFIPKTKVENVTTEGKWQTTASLSLH